MSRIRVNGYPNSSGLVTDLYSYDAFGRTIGQSGSTANPYLFAGEQRDFNVELDYLRARYLNVKMGRFYGHDPFEGILRMPMTLHRYLYVLGNPLNDTDPTGRVGLEITIVGSTITVNGRPYVLGQGFIKQFPDRKIHKYYKEFRLASHAAGVPESWAANPSLISLVKHESSWDPRAQNPDSTAFGLFQFLDSTWATVGVAKTADPYLQAVAGFRYIRDRYETPERAWAFWQATVLEDAELAPIDLRDVARTWISKGWGGY